MLQLQRETKLCMPEKILLSSLWLKKTIIGLCSTKQNMATRTGWPTQVHNDLTSPLSPYSNGIWCIQVRFGQTLGLLNEIAGGDTVYYEVPGGKYHHHVVLSGLSSHTKYFYQCGIENSNVWSDLKYFTTARTKNDTDPFKVRELLSTL